MNDELKLADGSVVEDPRLDRLIQFDERSRNFPARELVAGKKQRSYTWSCPIRLNQYSEGACVGFSIAHEAAARPVLVKGLTNQSARDLYKRAQQLDPWPGESPDYEGTSVLAGIKAAQEIRWYKEYRWCFGSEDLILSVGYKGPCVLGVNWYSDMFFPDDDGFIKVAGQVEGGHAILCNQVNIKGQYFGLVNSWGFNWGIEGRCRISFKDMERLLYERGEACVPVKREFGITNYDTIKS